MATALDVVGDRWTLLILRELLGGPARFQQLLDGLPGIARNLLAGRLRRLERDGIVRRVQAQGASLYALTELGAAARPALEELGFWGARLRPITPAVHQRSVRAIAMALQAVLGRAGEFLPADTYLIELDVEGECVEIRLGPDPSAAVRLSLDADASISVPGEVLAEFLSGRSLDRTRFALESGAPAARDALLKALDGPAALLR